MLNLSLAQQLITLISFSIAYFIIITFAGAFRAWITDKMGDPSAAEQGFMSLNPLVHIDPLGFGVGVFFYIAIGVIIAWGRFVPFNPHMIVGKYRWLRISIALFSNTIAYVFIALASLVPLIILFGKSILAYTQYMILSKNLNQAVIAQVYDMLPPLTVSIGFILVLCVYLSILLAVVYSFVNMFSLGVLYWAEKQGGAFQVNPYMLFIAPMLLIMLFSQLLELIITQLVLYLGYGIAFILRIG